MMSWMASCVLIHWFPNGQRTKCMLDASNPCPHSHMRKLDANGWIKPKQKCNVKVKVKCVMWNKRIDGLATNHSPTPLPEQKWIWVLETEEMESSSKINLKDMSLWMSIKDAYRLETLITTKLSKEGCISLVVGRRTFHVARKHD